jgi:hypothetical protein
LLLTFKQITKLGLNAHQGYSMKYSLVLVALLSVASLSAAPQPMFASSSAPQPMFTTSSAPQPVVATSSAAQENVLEKGRDLRITVLGQGVAPMNTSSPAHAYALAKRAATAEAYRLIAEKVKGVRIDGQDLIRNMMIQRSTIRTSVQALVRNANIVDTTFKEGLCEVEMEIIVSHSQFK